MEIKDNLLLELQVQSWSLQNEEGLRVKKTRGDEDFEVVDGGMRLRIRNVSGMEGSSRKAGCGEDFGIDSGSCGYLGRTPR